ncbi:MAG: hypothetical protein KC609_02660 [Myxococcales bacterium]|nr:hypothetical protein [Myxococcales bacterium]
MMRSPALVLASFALVGLLVACSPSATSSNDAQSSADSADLRQAADVDPSDVDPSDVDPSDLVDPSDTVAASDLGDTASSDGIVADGDTHQTPSCGSSTVSGPATSVEALPPLPTGPQPTLTSCTAGVWYKIRVAQRSQPLIRVQLQGSSDLAIDLQLYSRAPSDPSWQPEGDKVGQSIDLKPTGSNAIIADLRRVLEPGVDYYLWLLISDVKGLAIPVEAPYSLTLSAGCSSDADCQQASTALTLCHDGICLDCKSAGDCLSNPNGPSCDPSYGCSCHTDQSDQCLSSAACQDAAIGTGDDTIGFCQ